MGAIAPLMLTPTWTTPTTNPAVFPGPCKSPPTLPPIISLIDYNPHQLISQKNITPADCATHLDTTSVSWVDVKGLGSEAILRQIGQVFNLHPLVLEDVVNVPQRPKVEEYQDQLLLIARMVTPRKPAAFLVNKSALSWGSTTC